MDASEAAVRVAKLLDEKKRLADADAIARPFTTSISATAPSAADVRDFRQDSQRLWQSPIRRDQNMVQLLSAF
jgi:hypothetical protein